MPAFEPIHIPTYVAEKYQNEIKTIKKYLTDAFPHCTVDIAYNIDLFSIGFRASDDRGNNVVYFRSQFLEDLNSPLTPWLDSSGIKEYFAMNNESVVIINNTGKLQNLRP